MYYIAFNVHRPPYTFDRYNRRRYRKFVWPIVFKSAKDAFAYLERCQAKWNSIGEYQVKSISVEYCRKLKQKLKQGESE